MVGLLLAFRWALLGTPAPHGLLVASLLVTMAIFVAQASCASHSAERTLADDA